MTGELEAALSEHLGRLAVDIGPRPIGSAGNEQAYEYVRGVLGATDAQLGTHEVVRPFELAEKWACRARASGRDETVSILPGVSSPAVDRRALPVTQRIYSHADDFEQTPPESGSIAVVALGAIHESEACAIAAPAATVAWFREHHVGLYSGNCSRPEREPKVAGFAVSEETARRWVAHPTQVDVRIETTNRTVPIRNVVADFGGDVRKPNFVAHYDSKPGVAGGNDNASGVAVLLALAQRWPTERPARFVFFDGEEAGVVGSQAYVDELAARGGLSKVEMVVCVDSVGLGELHLYTADRYGPFPKPLVDRASEAFAQHGWQLPQRAARSGGSDYRPFHDLGVPCLFLSDFPNRVRHTTADTAGVVDLEVLARLTEVLAVLGRFDRELVD